MIIFEFLIFVVSSGLFCSERFRNHLWAVLVAGAIATGSSLLFAYDLGQKMMGHEKEPPVVTKFITQTITKPGQTSDPTTIGKAHTCDQYPDESVRKGEEGVTRLGFKVLADGTVDAVKVTTSSGSDKLDEAAAKCVANWHYRPAVKDGQIIEKEWKAKVTWKLASAEQLKAEAQAKPEDAGKLPEGEAKTEEKTADTKDQSADQARHWYNPRSWFSGSPGKTEADKKDPDKKSDSQ